MSTMKTANMKCSFPFGLLAILVFHVFQCDCGETGYQVRRQLYNSMERAASTTEVPSPTRLSIGTSFLPTSSYAPSDFASDMPSNIDTINSLANIPEGSPTMKPTTSYEKILPLVAVTLLPFTLTGTISRGNNETNGDIPIELQKILQVYTSGNMYFDFFHDCSIIMVHYTLTESIVDSETSKNQDRSLQQDTEDVLSVAYTYEGKVILESPSPLESSIVQDEQKRVLADRDAVMLAIRTERALDSLNILDIGVKAIDNSVTSVPTEIYPLVDAPYFAPTTGSGSQSIAPNLEPSSGSQSIGDTDRNDLYGSTKDGPVGMLSGIVLGGMFLIALTAFLLVRKRESHRNYLISNSTSVTNVELRGSGSHDYIEDYESEITESNDKRNVTTATKFNRRRSISDPNGNEQASVFNPYGNSDDDIVFRTNISRNQTTESSLNPMSPTENVLYSRPLNSSNSEDESSAGSGLVQNLMMYGVMEPSYYDNTTDDENVDRNDTTNSSNDVLLNNTNNSKNGHWKDRSQSIGSESTSSSVLTKVISQTKASTQSLLLSFFKNNKKSKNSSFSKDVEKSETQDHVSRIENEVNYGFFSSTGHSEDHDEESFVKPTTSMGEDEPPPTPSSAQTKSIKTLSSSEINIDNICEEQKTSVDNDIENLKSGYSYEDQDYEDYALNAITLKASSTPMILPSTILQSPIPTGSPAEYTSDSEFQFNEKSTMNSNKKIAKLITSTSLGEKEKTASSPNEITFQIDGSRDYEGQSNLLGNKSTRLGKQNLKWRANTVKRSKNANPDNGNEAVERPRKILNLYTSEKDPSTNKSSENHNSNYDKETKRKPRGMNIFKKEEDLRVKKSSNLKKTFNYSYYEADDPIRSAALSPYDEIIAVGTDPMNILVRQGDMRFSTGSSQPHNSNPTDEGLYERNDQDLAGFAAELETNKNFETKKEKSHKARTNSLGSSSGASLIARIASRRRERSLSAGRIFDLERTRSESRERLIGKMSIPNKIQGREAMNSSPPPTPPSRESDDHKISNRGRSSKMPPRQLSNVEVDQRRNKYRHLNDKEVETNSPYDEIDSKQKKEARRYSRSPKTQSLDNVTSSGKIVDTV